MKLLPRFAVLGFVLALWSLPAFAQPAPSWDGSCSIFYVGGDSTNGYTQGWMDYGCSGSFTNGSYNGTVTAEVEVQMYYQLVTGHAGPATESTTWPNIPSSSTVQLGGSWTPDTCWRAVGTVTWEVGPRYYACYRVGYWFSCGWYQNTQSARVLGELHCP